MGFAAAGAAGDCGEAGETAAIGAGCGAAAGAAGTADGITGGGANANGASAGAVGVGVELTAELGTLAFNSTEFGAIASSAVVASGSPDGESSALPMVCEALAGFAEAALMKAKQMKVGLIAAPAAISLIQELGVVAIID